MTDPSSTIAFINEAALRSVPAVQAMLALPGSVEVVADTSSGDPKDWTVTATLRFRETSL